LNHVLSELEAQAFGVASVSEQVAYTTLPIARKMRGEQREHFSSAVTFDSLLLASEAARKPGF
jgi:hypothetical protein